MANKDYAGFWMRFLAGFIDTVILSVLSYILFGNSCSGSGFCIGYNNWQTIIPTAYIIGFWIWKSATPGKMLLGLKITNENNKALTPKDAVIRFFAYIPSAIAGFLGFFWIAFDSEKQGWHDKIAKTHVVQG